MAGNKKDLILQSALKLFSTKGFHGTPTSLISKEAGVATGTLFNYFESKEDLINKLYLECKKSMLEFIKFDFKEINKENLKNLLVINRKS